MTNNIISDDDINIIDEQDDTGCLCRKIPTGPSHEEVAHRAEQVSMIEADQNIHYCLDQFKNQQVNRAANYLTIRARIAKLQVSIAQKNSINKEEVRQEPYSPQNVKKKKSNNRDILQFNKRFFLCNFFQFRQYAATL